MAKSNWLSPTAAMWLAMPKGDSYSNAFVNAEWRWNTNTGFTLLVDYNSSADPCSNPNVKAPINGVKWGTTFCGDPWGSRVLATTSTWAQGATTVQSGIVFNSNYSWGVYSGPFKSSMADFRRVAVHELGHVIGLAHDDESLETIMGTFQNEGNTLENPTSHDIACVNALYGVGPSIVLRLEEPTSGGTASGVANIRGWAIGMNGINRVEVSIDGVSQGNIPSGGPRDDVGSAYPDYPGSYTSGFSMAFNYNNLSRGTHTLTVKAVGMDATQAFDSATFNVVRFDPPFISDPAAISLGSARAQVSGNVLHLDDVWGAGKYYDLTLSWRPASQKFEPIQVTPAQ